jgi:hypothetical protein
MTTATGTGIIGRKNTSYNNGQNVNNVAANPNSAVAKNPSNGSNSASSVADRKQQPADHSGGKRQRAQLERLRLVADATVEPVKAKLAVPATSHSYTAQSHAHANYGGGGMAATVADQQIVAKLALSC